MIDLFSGEFLVSPIPLNLTLNYCSHKCAFCFANLSVPNRRANVKQIMSLLANHHERKTIVAHLLQQRYPVLISNHVDLLAHSNAPQALPIVQTMVELGIPLQFQTRGGKQEWVDELLAMVTEPSVWYISISSLDDDLRRKLEPGAPTVASRFRLMERLAGMGHTVMVGLNPLVREWQPDPEPLLRQARESGAVGAWIERLHLSYTQINNMSPREKANIGDDLMTRARKRRTAPVDMRHFLEARESALSLGMEVYSIGQGCRSDFFEHYRRVYPKSFPTNQTFVNFCWDHDLEDVLIPFELYAAVLEPHFPVGTWPIDQYLGSVAHNLWWQFHVPPQMTYRQLLSVIWGQREVKYSPSRLPCFAYAAKWDDGSLDGKPGWIVYVDESGLPYLTFTKRPEGFADYYTHVDLPDEDLGEVQLSETVVPAGGSAPA